MYQLIQGYNWLDMIATLSRAQSTQRVRVQIGVIRSPDGNCPLAQELGCDTTN